MSPECLRARHEPAALSTHPLGTILLLLGEHRIEGVGNQYVLFPTPDSRPPRRREALEGGA